MSRTTRSLKIRSRCLVRRRRCVGHCSLISLLIIMQGLLSNISCLVAAACLPACLPACLHGLLTSNPRCAKASHCPLCKTTM